MSLRRDSTNAALGTLAAKVATLEAALAALTTAVDDLNLETGVYTPGLTGVANVASYIAQQCIYARLGDTVIVSGTLSLQPTSSATSTILGISLPIASNLASAADVSGSGASGGAQQSGAIEGDAANDRAQIRFLSIDATQRGMYFTFSYRIKP